MKTLVAMVVAAGMCVGISAQPETVGKGAPAGASQPAVQENAKRPVPNAAAQENVRGAPASRGPTVTIKFEGGTISDYYAQLRAVAKPTPVNVVAGKEILETKVPQIWLQDVSMDTAVFAVQAAAPGGLRWKVSKEFGELYQLQSYEPQQQPGQTAKRSETTAYPLDSIIKSYPSDPPNAGITIPVETVLSSIEQLVAVTKVAAGDEPPKIVFHRESGLLMISGDSDMVRAIVSMIRTLEGQVDRRRAESRSVYRSVVEMGNVKYQTAAGAAPASISAVQRLAGLLPGASVSSSDKTDGTVWTVRGPMYFVVLADLMVQGQDSTKVTVLEEGPRLDSQPLKGAPRNNQGK